MDQVERVGIWTHGDEDYVVPPRGWFDDVPAEFASAYRASPRFRLQVQASLAAGGLLVSVGLARRLFPGSVAAPWDADFDPSLRRVTRTVIDECGRDAGVLDFGLPHIRPDHPVSTTLEGLYRRLQTWERAANADPRYVEFADPGPDDAPLFADERDPGPNVDRVERRDGPVPAPGPAGRPGGRRTYGRYPRKHPRICD